MRVNRTFTIQEIRIASTLATIRGELLMEPSNLSVFQRLNARMNWLSSRQVVLAENVANANTPGYKPRDLKEQSFDAALARVPSTAAPQQSAVTSPKHFKLMASISRPDVQQKSDDMEASIAGNAVDLETELKKAGDTALEYQTMTHLYRKHMEMLRMAVAANGT